MIKPMGGGLMLMVILFIMAGAVLVAGGFSYTAPKTSGRSPDVQVQSTSNNALLQPLSNDTNASIASEEAACTHFDHVCRPASQLSCCAETRIVCAASRCTGIIPPATTYDATGPIPTADPSCNPALDQVCQSVCADADGFVCF